LAPLLFQASLLLRVLPAVDVCEFPIVFAAVAILTKVVKPATSFTVTVSIKDDCSSRDKGNIMDVNSSRNARNRSKKERQHQ
jgi:hypothetical protein